MSSYIFFLLRKTINSVISLFLLICLIFILLRLSPGNPAHKFISPEFSPELSNRVTESFDLNSSLAEQFYKFVSNTVLFDFGISYIYRQPVMKVIMSFLPFTIILALTVFITQLLIAVFLSTVSFLKRGKMPDRILNKISLILYSTPTYVLAVLLILLFSVRLGIFPSAGLTSSYSGDTGFFSKISDYAYHLVLPVLTLSLIGSAFFYKYIRENLEAVSRSPYIVLLSSNGLKERTILIKHILPNALNPLISVSGVELGMLLSGALITETIFALPGMGRLAITAILQRDYPLVIGCTFVSGFFIILANILSDIVKAVIDKRIKTDLLN